MKYWTHTIIIILVGFLLGQCCPWWTISILALISAFSLRIKFWLSSMFGLLGGFLLWAGVAVYQDIENQHILSDKIAELFGGTNNMTLVLITGLLGGVLCALASLAGSSLRFAMLQSTNK